VAHNERQDFSAMFSINSQFSGFALRQSATSVHREKQAGRLMKTTPGGGRRTSLTLNDLESSEPFENLKNIDRPHAKVSSKHDGDQVDAIPMGRVSFIGQISDVKRSTTEPTKSTTPANVVAKSTTTQEPLTSLVPRPTDVKQPEPVKLPVPVYSDAKRTTTQELLTSVVPRSTDVKQPEPVKSPVLGYSDAKRSTTQEPVTSPVRDYTDVKTSTQARDTLTSAVCEPSDAERAPAKNETFCLGKCTIIITTLYYN